jgi:hypothetical protein
LGRLLAGTGATQVVLQVEPVEREEAWRLSVHARAQRPTPVHLREALERLARRMEAQLTLQETPGFELTLLLPRRAR